MIKCAVCDKIGRYEGISFADWIYYEEEIINYEYFIFTTRYNRGRDSGSF